MKYTIVEVREYPLGLILKQKGLSMNAFSKLTGISAPHLSRLEKGVYLASESTMKKITDAVEKLTHSK